MKLTDRFDISQLHVRVGATNKDRTKGLALVYVDARDVMDRLDGAEDVFTWTDNYEYIGTGVDKDGEYHCFKCTLTVSFGEGDFIIAHSDVGQGKEHKDAVSDALKRAAVKFGVARYLYDTPNKWFKLNEYRQFESTSEEIISYLMKQIDEEK